MNLFPKIQRPKRATGTKPGTITPASWNLLIDYCEAMERAIRQSQIQSTPDIVISSNPTGTYPRLARRGGGSSTPPSGPFCKKYREISSENSFIYLLGGTVTGGEGNITVPDIELAEVGSEPEDGTHVWLGIQFQGIVEDDVLMPGGSVTEVEVGQGLSLPSNSVPTSSDPAGTLYMSLGSWAQGVFTPSSCGNIMISHCAGSLTPSRIVSMPEFYY
jgi:hypothetical protein